MSVPPREFPAEAVVPEPLPSRTLFDADGPLSLWNFGVGVPDRPDRPALRHLIALTNFPAESSQARDR